MTSKPRDLVTLEGASLARRQFLGVTGRAGLLALGAPALALNGAAESYAASERTYAGGSYGLILDGVFAGFLTGFSGGSVVAEVLNVQPVGPDRVQKKRLGGPPHAEPITIECGLPMAKPFYDWIKSSIEPGSRPTPKNGAIVEFDFNLKEMGRRNFSNAFITEVEFPACDAASKDPARLTVTFQPQTVTLAAGAGQAPRGAPPARWLRTNFTLKIQGVEQALTHTTAIEAVHVKLKGATSGNTKEPVQVPSTIDVANLSITVADSFIGQIYTWHQEFVVKGDAKLRPGVLEYMTPDLKSAVVTLKLLGLGIVKVAPEAVAAGVADKIRRSKVEMYCEAVTVDFKA